MQQSDKKCEYKELCKEGKTASLRGSLLLLLTAFVWGFAFVAQSVGMDHMGPFTFCGGRFLLGGMVLLPFVLTKRKKAGKEKASAGGKTVLIGGICCGLALCAASLFQQYGILYTTVGKAGFITTLYIIMVPILGVFLRRRIAKRVWAGAVLAALGMYLLCMKESLSLGIGDTYVFICAFLFSIHILVVDHFARETDGVTLSCVQFFTAGIVGVAGALILEKPMLSDIVGGLLPLAYAGIFSSGIGYTLQVIGQKYVEPAAASLIMSMESVVSALAGWLLLHQSLTGRELSGCVFVFGAVILVQFPEKKRKSEYRQEG